MMKRRRFIKSTFEFGLVALLGIKTFGQNIFKDKSGGKMNASASLPIPLTIDNIISRGDIQRKSLPASTNPWVVLYQGNGRFGSCFGPWGLHAAPDKKPDYSIHGSTRFTHIKHYIRGKFNADYLIPVGTIYWETEPQAVKDYEQYQSFYDGTVTTRVITTDYAITIISWFDPVQKDIAGFQIDVKGNCPAIIVSTPRLLSVWYDQQIVASIEERLDKDLWQAAIKCLNANSTMKVRSDTQLKQVKDGLKLSLKPGRNNILIAVNGDINVSADQSLHQTKTWWHTTWKNSGWLDLPDETAQKVWVRSLAYTLYSHNDDGFGCSPPTGLAGNAWPFPFPFDSSCRHLLLLMTGQTNAARKWIEFWHSRFEGLKDYTKRIFKSEGIFMPHVFPYGQAYNYHYPDVPNKYYYPIYNSAVMVRLADQTAVMVNNPQWTKTYAEPLIHEAAKFYLSHLKKGDDDLWHLHIIPSISLDEAGDINKPDYVSGLISAQYALQKAIEYGLDSDHRMQSILLDGLAYKPLLAENGMYYNHFGLTVKDFGKQKLADQLFPLTHTPLSPQLSEPHRRAHELRYEIIDGAKIPSFIGHTLGEFILASARMHDAEAWRKDWDMMLPAKYTDPEFIQFYESTNNTFVYYVTTHGLLAQAILETTVSTWWDQLDLGPCIPWKDTVRFGNIRTLLGVTVSGEIKDGSGQATLHAWKDTNFKYQGQAITLKKGQKMTVKIKQSDKKL
jgi:hypothetical protein